MEAKLIVLEAKFNEHKDACLPSEFLYKTEEGVYNIPKNEEDAFKSFQWFGNRLQHVYFVSNDEPIGAADYYIFWGIGKEDFKLQRSLNGEYPKCPHGKVIATTDSLPGVPSIPISFLSDFVNSKATIKKVHLETYDVPLTYSGNRTDEKQETRKKLKLKDGEVIYSLFTDEMVDDCIKTMQEMEITEVQKPQKIKIKISTEEMLNAKFKDTLVTIEGYLKESEGDMSTGISYGASAVNSRMGKIKLALLNDLKEMAKSIEF